MRPTRLLTLFYFAVLGMELSYLYIAAMALLGGFSYTLVLILLLYPFALLSRLALNQSLLPHRLRLTLQVALVTLVILLVTVERFLNSLPTGPVDVFGMIVRMGFCGLVWWLGHTVPQEEVSYSRISFRLQMGILALLILSPVTGSALPVFLFFLLAPLVLSLTRWASSCSNGAAMLRPPNISHLLLAGATVIVPGMALILLLSPDVARAIVHWLGAILLKLSDWLYAQQKSAANPPSEFKFPFSCNIRPEEAVPTPTTPPLPPEVPTETSPVIMWLIVFAFFLATLTLVVFALRRLKARRRDRPTEPIRFQIRTVSLDLLRSLLSLFPQLLRKLWLWLASHFQRWKKRRKPSEDPIVSVRALYRRLLRWAARQGIARLPWQTPLEHLGLLGQKFPQQQDDLKQITEAYLLARYSQKATSQEEFETVKKAWQRIVAYHTHSRVRL